MPGNSQRRGRRTTAKKGAAAGSGGKNRAGLKGRGRTLPADERPWHKGYSGDEALPSKTAWKQEKERKAAAAEGRAPKIGVPGSKVTTRATASRSGGGGAVRGASARGGTTTRPRVTPGRRAAAPREAAELLLGRNPVLESLRTHTPCTALYVAIGIDVDSGSRRSCGPPVTAASRCWKSAGPNWTG
jgi:23S rRNA (guanosine2251-2'-O)-methyltransferase